MRTHNNTERRATICIARARRIFIWEKFNMAHFCGARALALAPLHAPPRRAHLMEWRRRHRARCPLYVESCRRHRFACRRWASSSQSNIMRVSRARTAGFRIICSPKGRPGVEFNILCDCTNACLCRVCMAYDGCVMGVCVHGPC